MPGNDDVAAGGEGGKAVDVGGVQVIQSIFASAYIQRVAVGQERFAAQLLDDLDDHRRIVGAQVGQVARLTEMDFDGCVFVGELDLADAGGLDQPLQLLGQIFIERGAQVGKIDFGCRHGYASCKCRLTSFHRKIPHPKMQPCAQ